MKKARDRKEGKKTMRKGVRARLLALSGIGTGRRFLTTLSSAASLLRPLSLYRRNKKTAREMERLSFADILKLWGIENAEEKKRVIRMKRLETALGLLLLAFGAGVIFLKRWNGSVLHTAECCAVSSVALLGLTLSLTSRWRRECLEKERFKPFVSWLLELIGLREIGGGRKTERKDAPSAEAAKERRSPQGNASPVKTPVPRPFNGSEAKREKG
ncbi:MAG: hypothetical protein K5657_05585 [Desulfovibrio sp.]|nr:hypothetical protein [Desulfovibrio sp.]